MHLSLSGHSHGGKDTSKGKTEDASLFEDDNALAIQTEDECDDEKMTNGSTKTDKDKKKKKKMSTYQFCIFA